MSTQQTTTLRTIGAASTALAISSASLNASLTFFTIPRCLELPPPLNARAWANMFRVTKWAVPIPMLVSGTGYVYLAWAQRHVPQSARLCACAGTLCFSIIPYTAAVVLPSINMLFEKLASWQEAAVGHVREDEETGPTAHVLIRRWGVLNLGRAIPVMLAGIMGLYSYL
ncbi:hypothetical protein E8E14_003891 [Neopestalotiopsis sp. 37M]|nr:hypothetical protein E8E14_003891 [Neopestalotiopsis sp. 37M]